LCQFKRRPEHFLSPSKLPLQMMPESIIRRGIGAGFRTGQSKHGISPAIGQARQAIVAAALWCQSASAVRRDRSDGFGTITVDRGIRSEREEILRTTSECA